MRDVALLESQARCNHPYHSPGCLCTKANPLAKAVIDLLDYVEELKKNFNDLYKNTLDQDEDVYF